MDVGGGEEGGAEGDAVVGKVDDQVGGGREPDGRVGGVAGIGETGDGGGGGGG